MDLTIWNDMTQMGVPAIEKILRPILIYAFLVIGLRLAGKRELAQLNSLDLVVLLTLSNTVQNAIIGNDNSLTGGMLGAITLLAVNHFFIRYLFRHRKLNQLIEGEPVELIAQGKMQEHCMRHELITEAELTSAAHRQGFASLAEVDRAVLEPGGVLSFFGKDKHPDIRRHNELITAMSKLSMELNELRGVVNERRRDLG